MHMHLTFASIKLACLRFLSYCLSLSFPSCLSACLRACLSVCLFVCLSLIVCVCVCHLGEVDLKNSLEAAGASVYICCQFTQVQFVVGQVF